MAVTQEAVQTPATTGARRNEKVGNVVSTKMTKTIVVEVEMRKAHAKYKRIVRSTKLGAHGRCGQDSRDSSAEQAEAVDAGRDCATLVPGPD